MNELVDNCLEKCFTRIWQNTSWWEVVDTLFQHGYIKEAITAQRYAVPNLFDIVDILTQTHKQHTDYKDYHVIAKIQEKIIEAMKHYLILSSPTKLDIEKAKFIVFDLQEFSNSIISIEQRHLSTVYLWVKLCFNKSLKFNYSNVDLILFYCSPSETLQKYIDYHKQENDSNIDKYLYLDEYHRVSHSSFVEESILVDMRQSNYEQHVILSVQSIEAIVAEIFDLANALFILSKPTLHEFELFKVFLQLPQKQIQDFDKIKGLSYNSPPIYLRHLPATSNAKNSVNKIFSPIYNDYMIQLFDGRVDSLVSKKTLVEKHGWSVLWTLL